MERGWVVGLIICVVGLMITLFRWDPWLDGGILKDKFSWHFFLSINKLATLAGMFLLGWGEGGEAWKWRRRLFAWKEELKSDCCTLLLLIVLQTVVNDIWICQLHASSKYNVSSGYNCLTSRDQPLNNDDTSIISHKAVPLKVNIFAWLLLHNWLPRTENLIKSRVLPPNSTSCSGGCGSQEDIDHLLLFCDFYGHILYEIYNWLGLVSVTTAHINYHIIQFRSLGGFLKHTCSAFHLIWLFYCLDCLVWHEY